MTPETKYQTTRQALDHLLNFITTHQFVKLPAPQRKQHLQKLKQLIKAVMLVGE